MHCSRLTKMHRRKAFSLFDQDDLEKNNTCLYLNKIFGEGKTYTYLSKVYVEK